MPAQSETTALRGRGRYPGLLIIGCAALVVAGCGGATPAGAVVPVRTAGAAASPTTAGIPAIDPCALLTQQEASTMAGVAVSAGRLTSAGCYFSGYTPAASLSLQVIQTPDALTALAEFNAMKLRLSSPWIVTEVPALEDAAALARLESGGTSLSGVFVVDGAVVFNIVCEQLACSSAKLETGAKLIAGQLGIFKPTA